MGILRLGTIQTLDEWFTHTGGKTNLNLVLFNPRSRSLCVSSLLFLSFLLSLPSSLFSTLASTQWHPPSSPLSLLRARITVCAIRPTSRVTLFDFYLFICAYARSLSFCCVDCGDKIQVFRLSGGTLYLLSHAAWPKICEVRGGYQTLSTVQFSFSVDWLSSCERLFLSILNHSRKPLSRRDM